MIIAAEPNRRDDEAGFTLVEVVVCAALLVLACVFALGVLPALARGSQQALVRDAATNVARTEIERVRAATAYYGTAGYTPDHTYALASSATFATIAHVHRSLCTPGTTTDVAMNVGVAYAAASDTVTVTVTYPRNACDPTVSDAVVLEAQLAPSALVPGTTVTVPIDDPSLQ